MHKKGLYEKYFKRLLDIFCAALGIIFFSWLYILIAVMVKIKIGSPIIFRQPRPGKNEKIFNMYKFRTMTNECDENGILLPDDKRLTKFGKVLRATSLDELPELFCILKGDMSVIGPRPQLVRDMVFMSSKHRRRHLVRPGLSGLAQVNGRNDIDWEDKLDYDIKYIENISFHRDVILILKTIVKAIIRHDGISQSGMETADDYGDYLLKKGNISKEEYEKNQLLAISILEGKNAN